MFCFKEFQQSLLAGLLQLTPVTRSVAVG